MHVRLSGAAAVLLCAAGTLVPTMPAAAAVPRHCIAQAPSGASAPTMQCYATFAAAITAASSGRIELDPRTPAGLLPPDVAAANTTTMPSATMSPQNTVILSIDYTATNYGGSSFTWYQSAGCGNYSTSSMPSGWDDVIESVANYSGCGTTLYQNIGFSGSTFSVAVDGDASTLGTFNRQASSQKWCPSSSC